MHKGQILDQINYSPGSGIVSLVPSLSYYLYDLGLESSIIGLTKFCDSPNGEHHKTPKIGGTKNPRLDLIKHINPGIILANKEENRKEDIEELSYCSPVYLTDIGNLKDMFRMMLELGVIFNRHELANSYVERIQSGMDELRTYTHENFCCKVCYLIWKDPLMTVGSGTFIHEILMTAGFYNVFGEKIRYPEIQFAELKEKQPDVLLLSSEPFPFNEMHESIFKPFNCLLVDGRMFSWYGSFILQSISYLKALNFRIKNIR